MQQQKRIKFLEKTVQHETGRPPLTYHAHANIGVCGVEHPAIVPFLTFDASLNTKKDGLELQNVNVLLFTPSDLKAVLPDPP